MLEHEIKTLTAAVQELTAAIKQQQASAQIAVPSEPITINPEPAAEPTQKPVKAEKAAPKPEPEPTPEPVAEPAEAAAPQEEYTLDQLKVWVKAVFAKKGGNVVSELLKQFDKPRLSEVEQSQYPAFTAELDKLVPRSEVNL